MLKEKAERREVMFNNPTLPSRAGNHYRFLSAPADFFLEIAKGST
jgi:hypothetical protein